MYERRIRKKFDIISNTKIYMFKLVPKLKVNKFLNLLLANMKANSSILMRLEIAGLAQKKQKCIIFIFVPRCHLTQEQSQEG